MVSIWKYVNDLIDCCEPYSDVGTDEDERTVLYRTKSLDGTKPNTNSFN